MVSNKRFEAVGHLPDGYPEREQAADHVHGISPHSRNLAAGLRSDTFRAASGLFVELSVKKIVGIVNGPSLQFIMVSNLILQANFTDIQMPTLVIAAADPGVYILNWPANVGAFQLEFTPMLGGNWQPVAERPVLSGGLMSGQYFLTNQPTRGDVARFYRLRKL